MTGGRNGVHPRRRPHELVEAGLDGLRGQADGRFAYCRLRGDAQARSILPGRIYPASVSPSEPTTERVRRSDSRSAERSAHPASIALRTGSTV